jgi:inositol polyphosphate-4-phosphatase
MYYVVCRALWIQEEKELLQEVAGMGELHEPWHTRQVELLDRHLHLLHLYSQAKENLEAHKGMSRYHIDCSDNNLRTLRVHYKFDVSWYGMCSL